VDAPSGKRQSPPVDTDFGEEKAQSCANDFVTGAAKHVV
jgi:hypothetical protein